MPISTQNLLTSDYGIMIARGSILLILVFYAIFALIVVRQVDLMSKTLVTRVSPYVLALAIIHAGFAIGLIVLVWAML